MRAVGLGRAAWGLWAVWLGVPILGGIHLAGWLGQRWGHDQMVELKSEVDELISDLRRINVQRPDRSTAQP